MGVRGGGMWIGGEGEKGAGFGALTVHKDRARLKMLTTTEFDIFARSYGCSTFNHHPCVE